MIRPTRQTRGLFFIFIDIVIILGAVILAFNLRFDFDVPIQFIQPMVTAFLFFVIVRIIGFYYFRIYDISWRHFGFKDMVKLINIVIASTLIFIIFIYIFRNYMFFVFPRSVVPIEFFISLFGILAVRISKRLYLERYKKRALGKHTVIVAVADRANSIIRSLGNFDNDYFPIAIVSEADSGIKINNIEVYSWESLEKRKIVCEAAIIDHDINLQDVYEPLKRLGIEEIKIANNYTDVQQSLENITVEDLLARHPKDLDKSLIASFLKEKKVLITGAGGSIGSELVRQCTMFGAKELILVDHSEFSLYAITDEMGKSQCTVHSLLASVVDKVRMEEIFKTYGPEIVLHAAAYKHVPLVEDNIKIGIENNIIGTKNCIDLSIACGVKKFVLISTDKAVRPTNVMGATKRICELYAQNVNSDKTEIVSVRFGNVLGSSGSVIPKFKAQIEQGGPITVTHPDITRYFMLIPEACELVLQAGAIGKGGELFILDMGEPIKIVDLAKKMIDLSGKKNIDIIYTGLRPGEKLYEELLIDETETKTDYESITVAKPTHYEINKLNDDIDRLLTEHEPLKVLKEIVIEFNHKPHR